MWNHVQKNMELKSKEKKTYMGHQLRFSVHLSMCSFLQGNDFPLLTVAGANQAKPKMDGCGSLFQRLNQART